MILERDFPDHWKTVLLSEALGAGAPLGLIRLWGHCEARRNDVFALTAPQLAAIVRIGGKPADVEAALIEAKWIVRDGAEIHVLGWRERNAGWLAKIEAGKRRIAGGKRDASGKLSGEHPPGEHPATSPASWQESGGEERSGVEKSGEPPPPRGETPPVGASGSSISALTDTANFIIALKAQPGKKIRAALSHDAEAALARQAAALPLTDSQKAMLRWFYGLEPNDDDVDLRSRYRDADAIAKNLFTALERAEAYAEKNTAPSAGARTEKAREPWPPGTRDWLQKKYRAAAGDYDTWWTVPESVRNEFGLGGVV